MASSRDVTERRTVIRTKLIIKAAQKESPPWENSVFKGGAVAVKDIFLKRGEHRLLQLLAKLTLESRQKRRFKVRFFLFRDGQLFQNCETNLHVNFKTTKNEARFCLCVVLKTIVGLLSRYLLVCSMHERSRACVCVCLRRRSERWDSHSLTHSLSPSFGPFIDQSHFLPCPPLPFPLSHLIQQQQQRSRAHRVAEPIGNSRPLWHPHSPHLAPPVAVPLPIRKEGVVKFHS